MNKFVVKLPLLFLLILLTLIIQIRINVSSGGKKSPGSKMNYTPYIKRILPGAHAHESAVPMDRWLKVYNKKNDVIGYFVSTLDIDDPYIGYAGPVHSVVVLTPDKRIAGIELLPNRETPMYINALHRFGFFNKWKNIPIDEYKYMKIDAVTRVTYTSNSIIQNINKRLALINEEIAVEKKKSPLSWWDLAGFILIIGAIICQFIKKMHKVRFIIISASIVVFGLIKGEFLSVFFLKSNLENGFMLFVNPALTILGVLSLLVPLFFNKNFYCYYICPYGSCQELMGKILPDKIKVKPKVLKAFHLFRGIYFALIMLLIIIGLSIDFSLFEPFSLFIFKSASIFTIVLGVTFLIISLFINRPWCKFACPTGFIIEQFQHPSYGKLIKKIRKK